MAKSIEDAKAEIRSEVNTLPEEYFVKKLQMIVFRAPREADSRTDLEAILSFPQGRLAVATYPGGRGALVEQLKTHANSGAMDDPVRVRCSMMAQMIAAAAELPSRCRPSSRPRRPFGSEAARRARAFAHVH